jgi:hypothetical protein
LLDALESVTRAGPPELVALDRSDDTVHAFADVELPLPGGGRARYMLELERTDERWRVIWLAGPGLEWPAHPGGANGSLSVSPPPRTANAERAPMR